MSRLSVEQVAHAARTQVEQWIQGRSDNGDNPTDGLCLLASSYLCEKLREAGYEPTLMTGGVLCDRPDPEAPQFLQAGHTGVAVHYWVRVDRVVVDITADQFNPRLDSDLFDPVVIAADADLSRHEPGQALDPFNPTDGDWERAFLTVGRGWGPNVATTTEVSRDTDMCPHT